MEKEEETEISVVNQVVITISHNLVFHGKTKHFNIKLFFFLLEVQRNGDVKLIYCMSGDQLAYLFTKEFLRQMIGVCNS